MTKPLKNNTVPLPRLNARIPELDGLRGIAILLVVSFHYLNNQLVDNTDKLSKVISKVTSFGWVGVDLFFVLSGFLIGSVLITNRNSPNYFKTFFTRRSVRIIPNYFLLLLVFVIIWSIPYFNRNYFLAEHEIIPTWSYFLMVHNFFMSHYDSFGNRALSVTWSIAIEEQFYILFPFIVYFLKRKWLPFALITFIISAIIVRSLFSSWIPQYVLLPSRMDGLALGLLIAYANTTSIIDMYRSILVKTLWPLLVIIIVACAFLYWRYNDLGLVKFTLFGLGFSIFLVFALIYKNSWFGILLRNKILMWIGTISYSLYLFHFLILGLAYHICGKNGIGIHSRVDILITICAFAGALGISYLVYKALEQPMVKLGKRSKY